MAVLLRIRRHHIQGTHPRPPTSSNPRIIDDDGKYHSVPFRRASMLNYTISKAHTRDPPVSSSPRIIDDNGKYRSVTFHRVFILNLQLSAPICLLCLLHIVDDDCRALGKDSRMTCFLLYSLPLFCIYSRYTQLMHLAMELLSVQQLHR